MSIKHRLIVLWLVMVALVLSGCEPAPVAPTATSDLDPGNGQQIENVLTETATPDLALAERQRIENLVALGRLYGLVRYFHPSDEVAAVRQWDRLLMKGIETVQDAGTPAELAGRLEEFFAPLVPAVHVYLQAEGTPQPAVSLPDAEEPLNVVMWEHYGVAADGTHGLYNSKRVEGRWVKGQIPDGFRDPRVAHVADLGRGIAASVPVALFADAGGTFPRVSAGTDILKATGTFAPGTPDLAAVMMYWSVVRHFYPYLDVIDADWDATLAGAIARTLAAKDAAGRERALLWLLSQAGDGHALLLKGSDQALRVPALHAGWIEGRLVILADARTVDDPLPPGTVITSVDGEDAQTRFARLLAEAPGATEQFREVRAIQRILLGQRATKAVLTVRRPDGGEETVVASRDQWPGLLDVDPTRPKPVIELAPGIYYADLTRIEDEDLKAVLPQLERADGIIFDVRGYPTATALVVLQHLRPEGLSSARFLIPVTRLPNQEVREWDDVGWSLPPLQPQLTQNIAFLTDGRAMSYGETVMGIVEHYGLGEIVGEATGGTNGNINRIDLPTGQTAIWTGMLVLKHDGSRHHGVGIRPTVPVERTIAGIAAGRDEQLQAALMVVREGAAEK